MLTTFPHLTTARLRLREITAADVETLFAIHSDAHTMRWYGVEPITSLDEAVRLTELFMAWSVAGTGYRWGLERIEDGLLLGTCGLFRWNKSWRNCVTGYELASRFHGHGYMREALSCILNFGFTEMRLHRVQAETHPDNKASIGLAKRLGFRFEGVHREQAYWGGRFHDLNCYSLLESDWLDRDTPATMARSA